MRTRLHTFRLPAPGAIAAITPSDHGTVRVSPRARGARALTGDGRPYCTFTLTAADEATVNAHVFTFWPAEEQTPEKIASRPPPTVSVTRVPVANDALPEPPVTTERPAGLELTVTPLRPDADRVIVAVSGGGGGGAAVVTVSVADRVMASRVPEIVTAVDAVTLVVVIVNTTEVAPGATVTNCGTPAAGSLLAIATVVPPAGAAAVSTTTPCVVEPPVTLLGLTATFDSDVVGGAPFVTVSVPERVVPLYDAVIVTGVVADTAVVEIVNEPVKPVSGTVTLAGTDATAGLLLDSATTAPPNGAPTLSTTVPLDALPPATLAGLMSIVDSTADSGGACGVSVRTAEKGPACPSELIPRTRQNRVEVGRSVVG
jgi:hypothetical protein